MNAICPECEAEINLSDDIFVTEVVVCPDCKVGLEVKSTNPIVLNLLRPDEDDFGE